MQYKRDIVSAVWFIQVDVEKTQFCLFVYLLTDWNVIEFYWILMVKLGIYKPVLTWYKCGTYVTCKDLDDGTS